MQYILFIFPDDVLMFHGIIILLRYCQKLFIIEYIISIVHRSDMLSDVFIAFCQLCCCLFDQRCSLHATAGADVENVPTQVEHL